MFLKYFFPPGYSRLSGPHTKLWKCGAHKCSKTCMYVCENVCENVCVIYASVGFNRSSIHPNVFCLSFHFTYQGIVVETRECNS